MRKKSYVVFGLGSFGYSVAETLADCGYEVMVVDKGSDPIQSISPKVTYAVKADVTDTGRWKLWTFPSSTWRWWRSPRI